VFAEIQQLLREHREDADVNPAASLLLFEAFPTQNGPFCIHSQDAGLAE